VSADKRKTIEEQTKGLKETVRYQALDEKLSEKKRVKCLRPHAVLMAGEPCPTCGFQKI